VPKLSTASTEDDDHPLENAKLMAEVNAPPGHPANQKA
jgi:hypothetical protein